MHDTKVRIVGLCFTLKNFMGEKPIALLTFLTNLKNKICHYSVCEFEAVRDLAHFLSDDTKEVSYAYTTNQMRTHAHVYDGTFSEPIDALIQRFLTNNVLWEAQNRVAQASKVCTKTY